MLKKIHTQQQKWKAKPKLRHAPQVTSKLFFSIKISKGSTTSWAYLPQNPSISVHASVITLEKPLSIAYTNWSFSPDACIQLYKEQNLKLKISAPGVPPRPPVCYVGNSVV